MHRTTSQRDAIRKVLRGRANRATRDSRPFRNFVEAYEQCEAAADAVDSQSVPNDFLPLVERSIVISTVSAVEVYFREMLELIFKYCDPELFESKLKDIHPRKYTIDEIIQLHRHGIDPLEMAIASQSFQNADQVDRVFSTFLGVGFWNELLKSKFRSRPKLGQSEWRYIECDRDDFAGLKRIFALRHELVHDPARKRILDAEIWRDVQATMTMIFIADLYLSNFVGRHIDSEE